MRQLIAPQTAQKNNAQLHRSILIYGMVGILFTSLAVAMISIIPLSLKLKSNRDQYISTAAVTKAEVVSARLTDIFNMLDQIASRSAVRDQLITYAQGKATREATMAFISPKLSDALAQSQSVAGIEQLDWQGNFLLQVGQNIPAEFKALWMALVAESKDHALQPVKIDDELYLLSCHGIVDDHQQRIGTDVVLFRTSEFKKVVNDISTLGDSAVVAVERSNSSNYDILLSSRPLSAQEAAQHQLTLEQLGIQQSSLFDSESSPVLIAAAQAETTGWFATVQLDEADLYAETLNQVFGVAGLALLLAVTGAAGFSVILRPLAQGILVHEKELERLVTEKAEQYQAEYEERLAIEHDLHNVESALELSQARYKSMIEDVVDASSVAICITDAQLRVVWENQAAAALWEFDRESVIGSDKRELLQERISKQIEEGAAFAQKVLNSYQTGKFLDNIEMHFPEKPGRAERWLSYSSKPIRSGYYAGGRIEQYVDITEQKRLVCRIEQLAVTDELTGVYNRRGLLEFGRHDLARASRSGLPICCIFIDIDHFKDLNDRFGHPIGDQILKQLAERIRKQARNMDLVARYGGEEFVVLLPDTSTELTYQIAERIRASIANQPFLAAETQVNITVSAGVAHCDPADDLSHLLERADRAMYQAKWNGRNRVEQETEPVN